MKNFTKQNFKTNPLWIRLLIMTFMLLAGAGTALGKTIYLDVTKNWHQSGATFGVHAWGAGDEDKMMSLVSGNIYKVDIKDGQTNVIFLRMNNSNSFDWSKEWNRVETTFVNGKDLFTITDWSAGTWSTYTPPCNVAVSVSKSPNQSVYLTGETVTLTATTTNANSFAWKESSTQVSTSKTYDYTTNTVGAVTLKAVASSASCSAEEEVTLSFVNQKKIVVKCKGTTGIYLYTWNGTNDDDTKGWPGATTSTKDGEYYVWEISTESPINIIFNKGQNQNQTKDISNLQVGYEYTFTWDGGKDTQLSLPEPTELPKPCTKPEKPSIDLSTTSICKGDDTQVTITVTGEAEEYALYVVNNGYTKQGNSQESKTFTKTPSETTTYAVKAFNGTCESDFSESKTVTVSDKPSITLNPTSKTICKGDELDLSTFASSTATLTWWNGQTQITAPVSPEQNTTYTVKAINGACTVTEDFTVTVKELQGKPVFTTPNTTVCESTAFTLPATDKNGATLVWYTSAGASQDASVSGITTQTKYYAAIADNGTKCETASTNRAEYTVNVDKKPNLDLTSTTETICQGEQITLSDYVNNNTKVGTVKWYSNSARTTEITDPTVARTPQSNPTYYYASATNGVCTTPANKDLTVTVNPIPSITGISASDNGKICSGSSVSITVSATNAASYQLYIVKGGTYEAVGDEQTKNEFSVNEAGNYAVKALNGTCESPYSNISITNKQTLTTANFTITIPEDYNVNDGGEEVSVTPNVDGVGEITISYYKDAEKLNETPNSIGTYTVKMSVSEGTEYCEMEETEIGSFSILCAEPRPVYYSIELPETVYNGEKQETRIVLYAGAGELLGVKYKLNEEWVDPVNVGVYGVYVTVAEGSVVCAVQDYYAGDFEITCALATKDNYEITNTPLYYDGTVKTPTVSPISGAGAVSETMYKKGGNEVEPIDSGTYEVWIKSEVGANYCAVTEWLYVGDFSINCPKPESPSIEIVSGVITCNGALDTEGKIQITNYISTNKYYIGNNNDPILVDNDGFVNISTTSTTYFIKTTNICGVTSDPTEFTISVTDNKPTITGNNSFQPGGSTILSSDKAGTEWAVSEGGTLTANDDGTVTFTAAEVGKYTVTATYNGCETTFEISVQDDLYVWVRRPINKEKAYTEFFHEDQNSTSAIGGDLFYKEFASLPSDYKQYNQGGKKAEFNCEDKEGYMWYGFKVSKEAIAGNYYFTVHAPNDGGKKGSSAKYEGFHTHTYATQLVDMDADLYFVMDETPSNVNRGWNINAPVVLRASGDAKYNANNFADFVSLYVKDANTCTEEVSTFEWQKSSAQNGTYATYKSGKGINNIRTAEAGWYRCVVTYASGNTATSNAIQVTSGATDVKNYDTDKYDVSKSTLPIIMVNTNGVGFPSDPSSGYPSAVADDLKEKRSVDVKIKVGDEIVYDKKARMNYRGSSSLNFKKKSYAFCPGQDSCVFDKGAHDYVKTKKAKMFEVLGDASYKANDKDWVLYAATPDPSMMRNRLVFDLYQKMRPEDWGVHTKYVELIVDGEYQGVYVFMDKITANENRVNIKNSDGFIVKFDKTDCADRVGGYNGKVGDEKTFKTTRTGRQGISTYGTTVDQLFEIEYPEKEDIEDNGGNWEAFYKAVQKRWEDFETALANGEFSTVRTLIDYDSWADWFILTEFIKNQDGFRASCIFVYDGDKIKALPLWDQELSFDNRTRIGKGSNDDEGLMINNSSVYSDCFPAPFWFTGKNATFGSCGGDNGSSGTGTAYTNYLLKDPCFVSLLKSKWATYQTGVLSVSEISKMVTTYTNEVKEAQPREAKRWPYDEANRGKTSNGATIGYYGWEGDSDYFDYSKSKGSITTWATGRSTALDADGGLGKALNALNGEALIFTINPGTVETSPWIQNVITVNAPEGYDYTIDFSALEQGTVVKENGDTYTFKVPRPSTWGTAGNGTPKTNEYTITATIDAEGENACGAKLENTATAKVKLNDVTENCDPQIVKPQ